MSTFRGQCSVYGKGNATCRGPPYTDYINKCEIVKSPNRKTSERRAVNTQTETDNATEEYFETFYSSYSIIPNPSKGEFKLFCKSNNLIRYEIASLTGQIVEEGAIVPSKGVVDFNKANLAKGLYIIKVIDNMETVILKVSIN